MKENNSLGGIKSCGPFRQRPLATTHSLVRLCVSDSKHSPREFLASSLQELKNDKKQ
jgi:hypothetical protein